MRGVAVVCWPGTAWLSLLAVVACCAGCSAELTAMHGARGLVQGMVQGERHNQQDVAAATKDLSRAIVLGVTDGLQQAHLERLAQGAVDATMATLRQQGGSALDQVGPVLERALQTAIRDAILTTGAALRQSAERDMRVATTVLVRAATEAFLDTLTRYTGDVGGRTRSFAEDSLAPAAGVVMRTAMREAVAGVGEGVDGLNLRMGDGQVDMSRLPIRMMMREVGAGLAEGMKTGVTDTGHFKTLFFTSLGVMGALLLGVLAGAVVLWRRYQRTTRTLVTFARKMDTARQADAASVDELRQSIMSALSEQHQDKWMNRVMQRRGVWTGTDREARSAAVTDREARSAAVTDREARSAAVTDREARSAAVNDSAQRSGTPSQADGRPNGGPPPTGSPPPVAGGPIH